MKLTLAGSLRCLTCVMLLVSVACSGNSRRTAAASGLTLSLLNPPAEVGFGVYADLILRIANAGDSPVSICVVGKTVGLRSGDGRFVPVAFGGAFDGGCFDEFVLAPGSAHDIPISHAALPPVPGPEATLFCRLVVQLPLGQFYWPSDSFTLSAPEHRVRVLQGSRRSPSGA